MPLDANLSYIGHLFTILILHDDSSITKWLEFNNVINEYFITKSNNYDKYYIILVISIYHYNLLQYTCHYLLHQCIYLSLSIKKMTVCHSRDEGN